MLGACRNRERRAAVDCLGLSVDGVARGCDRRLEGVLWTDYLRLLWNSAKSTIGGS